MFITSRLRRLTNRLSQAMANDRSYLVLGSVALAFHLLVALAASALPELGDEPSFRQWAMNSSQTGIGMAYRPDGYWYDWLPAYLYVSKSLGWFYRSTGLLDHFGPGAGVLTFCIKLPMIALNLVTGWLIFGFSKGHPRHSSWPAAVWLFNPAIVLATDIFGYQDAFHTCAIVGAVRLLLANRLVPAGAMAAIGFLAKPQAAPFILAGAAFTFLRRGVPGLGRAALGGVASATLIVMPFLWNGRIDRVAAMVSDVPQVHQWLTGCAHNIWWLIRPVPPFYSDRLPLLLGLNGLAIGLLLFLALAILAIRHLSAGPTPDRLAGACAFIAFAFFMVVTQIHENHLYAMFPFLAMLVTSDRFHRDLTAALTVTFSLDLILTLYLINTDVAFSLGPLRVSTLNALANVSLLALWTYRLIRPPQPEVLSSPAASPIR